MILSLRRQLLQLPNSADPVVVFGVVVGVDILTKAIDLRRRKGVRNYHYRPDHLRQERSRDPICKPHAGPESLFRVRLQLAVELVMLLRGLGGRRLQVRSLQPTSMCRQLHHQREMISRKWTMVQLRFFRLILQLYQVILNCDFVFVESRFG